MGLRQIFESVRQTLTGVGLAGGRSGIRSPWAGSSLQSAVFADIFGADDTPATRAQAMTVPPVVKARHLICTILPNYPLRQYENAAEVTAQPAWLAGTDSEVHPSTRLTWTFDDMYFAGWSLWAVERSTDPTNGWEDRKGRWIPAIVDAARVPPERWTFKAQADGSVTLDVDGQPVENPLEVVLIPGPFEGILATATRTMRGAVNIEKTWVARARSPIPALELHQTTDDELDDDEIDALIAAWSDARDDPAGAVAYTPYNIEARPHGTADPMFLIEGRNAVRLDIANFSGLPATALDGSLSTASLTYSTEEGKRNELADLSLVMWRTPLEGRLSMDDVCPPGQRIALDLSDWLTPDQSGTAPARED